MREVGRGTRSRFAEGNPAARQRRRLAVPFEFWAHVLRHPELRARFAACHARFLEPLTDGVRHLAEARRALPSDVTPFQVVLAWNAMEVGLGLERLTHPPDVDMELARRMGWLLLMRSWAPHHQLPVTTARARSEYPMNIAQVRYQWRHVADLAASSHAPRLAASTGASSSTAATSEVVVRHAATYSPYYPYFAETGAR